MWIFTPVGFVSIVAHFTKPEVLMVRARLAGDLQRLFPGCKVTITPHADYRFRTELPRSVVSATVAGLLDGLTYTNVKGAIPHGAKVHDVRHKAMHDVWAVMHGVQPSSKPRQAADPGPLFDGDTRAWRQDDGGE